MRRKSLLGVTLAASVLAAAGAALAVTPIQLPVAAPPAARPAPAMRIGKLANGLRYAVVSSDSPKGGISFRLGVDVGSYDEADDERGEAHFVEHMAFNGSTHFKPG